jgi:NAD(P)-dependent dehydrogenase (short-subunit alcohol dehydrogenase family)
MDLEGEEYMSIIDAFRLDGKVAVVTGANTGLGQGMSVALAQAGAKVVGVARRSCEDTKKLIEADGGEFAEVIADLSDSDLPSSPYMSHKIHPDYKQDND